MRLRRLRGAEGRVEGKPQRRRQPSGQPIGCQAGPVVQRPAVVAGVIGLQAAHQQLPIEERRAEADRLQRFAGGVVPPGGGVIERGADRVESRPRLLRQILASARTARQRLVGGVRRRRGDRTRGDGGSAGHVGGSEGGR